MLKDLFGMFEDQKIQMSAEFLRTDFATELTSILRRAQYDVSITFGLCGSTGATCGEAMRKISPIWNETVIDGYSPANRQQLYLENSDRASFEKLLTLCCGQIIQISGLSEIMGIWCVARYYKIENVKQFLSKKIIFTISDDLLVELLAHWLSPPDGELFQACYDLALRRFDYFSKAPALADLSLDLLSALLDDERLVSQSEERVFEIVAKWIRGSGATAAQARDDHILHKVRFNLLTPAFLDANARLLLPSSTLLQTLIDGAATCAPAFPRQERPRPWSWPWYFGWGGPSVVTVPDRLGGKYVAGAVGSACVFLGAETGEVHQFNHKGTLLTVFKDVPLSTARNGVTCLACWGSRLVCAYEDTHVKVWDVTSREVVEITRQQIRACPEAGELTNTLISTRTEFSPPPRRFVSRAADGDPVRALTGCRDRLLVGYVTAVRVWAVEGDEWTCVHSKRLPYGLRALAWHRDGERVLSADDCCVRMWDSASGEESLVFDVRDVPIRAMVVHGSTLLALSPLNVAVAWCLDTGSLLRSRLLRPDAIDSGSPDRMFLAVLGPKLVTGVSYRQPTASFEVCVRSLETLEFRHLLWQAPGEAGDVLMTDHTTRLVAFCCSRSLVSFSSRGPVVQQDSRPYTLDKVAKARRVYVEAVSHNTVQAEIIEEGETAEEKYEHISALRAQTFEKSMDRMQRRRAWVPKWLKRSSQDAKSEADSDPQSRNMQAGKVIDETENTSPPGIKH